MRIGVRGKINKGFSLIETMIAAIVLVIGILSLAAMLGRGLQYMNTSQADYIAQQKAAEAVESIFTARDIGQTTWTTICNTASSVCCAGIASCTPGGVFVTGAQPLCDPGPDGIIGTADDFNGTSCAVQTDAILLPSTSGTLATPVRMPLTNYTRQIVINSVLDSGGNTIANVRQITVTIAYSSGPLKNRSYTLNAYISNFS
jgi:Tfp pilus assembly protein PilE